MSTAGNNPCEDEKFQAVSNCMAVDVILAAAKGKERWLTKTRDLLRVEIAEEHVIAEKELNSSSFRRLQMLGLSVPYLKVDTVKTGLYGRAILRLVSSKIYSKTQKKIIAGVDCLSGGDIVRVVPNNGPKSIINQRDVGASRKIPSGVVCLVKECYVEVAFDNFEDVEEFVASETLRLDKLPNNANYNRIRNALDALEKLSPSHPMHRCSQILFGEEVPCQKDQLNPKLIPFNRHLNEPQLSAIDFCLRSEDIALIHGPPGTGKTTTVVELIQQATQVHDMRVLVCAPSNIAIDNIVSLLAIHTAKNTKKAAPSLKPIRLIRLGHPARLQPEVLSSSLDAVVKSSDEQTVIEDVRSCIQSVVDQLSGKVKKPKKTNGRVNFRQLRQEAKELRVELRSREKKVIRSALSSANVILTTNTSAAGIPKLLGLDDGSGLMDVDQMFDLVIVDEAAQATEASCWIPMLLGKRVVLAGDNKQLPPTVKSKKAANGILGITLFDRVVAMYGNSCVKLLSIQYRMNQVISDWSSREMYAGKLVADASVAERQLCDIPYVQSDDDADTDYVAPLLMIDTAECGMEESIEDNADEDLKDKSNRRSELSKSKYNLGEADAAVKHVKALCRLGLREEDIAVVSPYKAQVHQVRSLLNDDHPGIEVRSVDGFQGREKEAIVLTLVRSNTQGEIGFLSDSRRLNVAITRAKRHVCIVCDSNTLYSSRNEFLIRMVEYFEDHAHIVSATDYLNLR